MRPDREKLFWILCRRFGLAADRAAALRTDLEPLFLMADTPDMAAGTGCGFIADRRSRRASERTQPLPMEIEPACVYARRCQSGMNLASVEAVVERFHEQVCGVIGYERVVEIGSALGDTLLDPLFVRTGAGGIDAYLNLQFLALYRVAAEAAGLAAEAEQLGLYIRRSCGVAEDCQEVDETHIIEETPDLRQAG